MASMSSIPYLNGSLKSNMKNLKSILLGLSLIALACKPDSVPTPKTELSQEIIYKEVYKMNDKYKNENLAIANSKSNEKRVVFLGNSITEGWVEMDKTFFEENNYIGRGISGETSPQLLLRFRSDVIDLKPKLVVIHIGTNDIAENTSPYDEDFTVHNINSMVDLAQANGIKVILASVVPTTTFGWRPELGDCSQKIIELNQRIKNLADKYDLDFADYHQALKNEVNGMNKDLAEDGVHPTPLGYDVMKSVVEPIIIKALD